MSDLLSVLECMTPHNLSALWEGDIFSVLLQSPFVIRAFEFGAADGGLDCSTRYPETSSYAERWATFVEQPPGRGHKVVLFDVKSTVAAEAGRQRYFTFPLQHALAAFYICVAAGDPAYIDVVPNYSQYADSASAERLLEDKSRKIFKLHATHRIWHPPGAYGGVDPTSSPYRMPRALLPAALDRIRTCALGHGTYQNPWNQVEFPQWRPALTAQTRWMTPTEGTPQFTAYTQAMHIQRAVSHTGLMRFDFVGLQPRLGDFQFDGMIIQHKVDTDPRSPHTTFTDVFVARGEPPRRRYYFNAFERFDFLFYQFEYSGLPARRVLFFVPECELPDVLYTSTHNRGSFDGLRSFLMDMDDDLEWVRRIREIIVRYPCPRVLGPRPLRHEDFAARHDNDGVVHEEDVTPDDTDEDADAEAEPGSPLDEHHSTSAGSSGRALHAKAAQNSFRRFWSGIMMQCAERMSGLLVILPRIHPFDFLYCRYAWSPDERSNFVRLGRPPQCLHSMPAAAEGTPICYLARYRECSFQGPEFTSALFRRLNSTAQPRVIICDVGGPDVPAGHLTPAVIPSEDVTLTANQRRILAENHGEEGEWLDKMPTLSDVLDAGMYTTDYAFAHGALAYEYNHMADVWSLLDRFTGLEQVEHPTGHWRDPSRYRCSIREANVVLKDIIEAGAEEEGEWDV